MNTAAVAEADTGLDLVGLAQDLQDTVVVFTDWESEHLHRMKPGMNELENEACECCSLDSLFCECLDREMDPEDMLAEFGSDAIFAGVTQH